MPKQEGSRPRVIWEGTHPDLEAKVRVVENTAGWLIPEYQVGIDAMNEQHWQEFRGSEWTPFADRVVAVAVYHALRGN